MKLILLLFLSLNAFIIYSQTNRNIAFQNSFEKKILNQISDSQNVEILDLYLAFEFQESSYSSKQNLINSFIDELSAQINNKPLNKKIKIIYKKTHERFLKKYDEKTYFNEIFNTGSYNCVTASALYAVVLTKLNIPFLVKETPVHVYLVADPEGSHILMESTAPQNGTFYIDENYKRDFVKHLKDNKIISETEFNQKTTQELFRQYYDENKTINAKELAALQYSNKGLSLFEDKKYQNSVENMQKAYMIYPSQTIHYMYTAALMNYINEQLVSKKFNGKTLGDFINLSKSNAEGIVLASDYFVYASNEWMINKPSLIQYKELYNQIKWTVDTSINIEPIDQHFYQTMGRHYGLKKEYYSSIVYLDSAYQLNPENLGNQELLQIVVSSHVCKDRNHKQEIDSLDKYTTKYPFLIDIEPIQNYYSYIYMSVIDNLSRQNKTSEALNYLSKFEQLVKDNGDFKVSDKYIQFGFENLLYSYIQKGKNKEATECLNRAIALSSDPEELNNLKTVMKEYQNVNTYQTYKEPEIVNAKTEKTEIKPRFSDQMDQLFPGKWEIFEREENGKKVELNKENFLSIESSHNKDLIYVSANKKENGRWAVRGSQRLLYLVPKKNENDYLLFYVIQLDDNTMELKLYKDKKPQNIIIRLKKVV